MEAIRAEGLTKQFKDVLAVDQVSFVVKEGEIFGFLGPNGAGKSTTIRMLATLTLPTKGTAYVNGKDVVKESDEVRKSIGLVSEKMILYDRLTAYENLRLFGNLYHLPSKRLSEKIEEFLKLVDMWRWKDHRVETFSTGMKQRVNVIRALLHSPKVLFLDEPTLGLDPQTTRAIREFILKVNDMGTTVILTTHIMSEADAVCQEIGIIDHGKIVALDTPRNLKKNIKSDDVEIIEVEFITLFTDMLNTLQNTHGIDKVIQLDANNLRLHLKKDFGLRSLMKVLSPWSDGIRALNTLEPTLEDVFIKLTGHEMRDQASKKAKKSFAGAGAHRF